MAEGKKQPSTGKQSEKGAGYVTPLDWQLWTVQWRVGGEKMLTVGMRIRLPLPTSYTLFFTQTTWAKIASLGRQGYLCLTHPTLRLASPPSPPPVHRR